MTTTVFDSLLFRDMFGTPAMRAIFDDRAYVARCIDVETALARAQARAGLIPPEAARDIGALARVERIDFDALSTEAHLVGYPILPLVHQLSDLCGDAGRYVHWGATTQDIMDSAMMLQCRDGLDLIEQELTAVRAALKTLAERHARTLTAGRTHLQHALPLTFGFRAAVWLSTLNRHAERLAQTRARTLMVSFGGAVGTLASLNNPEAALSTRACLAEELGLSDTHITWHVARDGLAEIAWLLAAIGGSLAKIATDVMIMASTEFGEVAEPFVPGRGASSTMPQKRNPISCELITAAARLLRTRSDSLLDAQAQDFERATGPWHLELSAIPESFLLAASALSQSAFMLGGLTVDTERMRRNLDLTSGLIVAEAVMMGLAPHIGRQQAHDLIYDACRLADRQHISLYDALAAEPQVTAHLDDAALRRLTDPASYLGAAEHMTRAVIANTQL